MPPPPPSSRRGVTARIRHGSYRRSVIERSVHTTNAWLKQIAERMGEDDRADAYRALRAVLHALRDRLTVDEAAQFAAQLPELIRDLLRRLGSQCDPAALRDCVRRPFRRVTVVEARLHGTTEASTAVEATMAVVRDHVSEGEMEDVMAVLPRGIRELLAPVPTVPSR